MSSPETVLIQHRQRKLDEIRAMGVDPYPHKFAFDATVSETVTRYATMDHSQLDAESHRVRTCGRILALRGFGKAAFCHISDGVQKIQFYIKNDVSDAGSVALFKQLDLGDIVGVDGRLFRTRTGELTILVQRLTLLAKCYLPLPEKWHGLTDVEIRYRQRYLDLIVNPEARRIFQRRSAIVQQLRRFLEARGYLEVETPMMHPLVGGATARPFITYHNTLDMKLYLRIAPELYLKRLVVGGMERVYEINRNFRNEGISTQHNPEFTMLEFYQAYSDFRDLMALTREMLTETVDAVCGTRLVPFKEHVIDFDGWREFTLRDAIRHFWTAPGPRPEPEQLNTRAGVVALLERISIGYPPKESYGKLLGLLFEEVVEHQLVQPTFIYDYPVELSPLSKRKPDEPGFVERFELYIAGMEIANAYSELNDPIDQGERFREQVRQREGGDEEAQMMDEDYIRALSYGMPPTAGEGIGIDRLAMILTNSPSIRDVILFPLMKPEAPAAAPDEAGTEAAPGPEAAGS
ncbi:MAG TPA: lysine--tRNA ligase [Acidobacteriota bacterium]|nr:lysine--tRNA ligase [Acidobacteriota bacterium]HQG92859.1 lysine--tRNA ligase [Acidobacteriota bacterium]